MKKIVITTSSRYEDDIIESFCRHSLTFADMILINASIEHADNTLGILKALVAEGLNIVLYYPENPKATEDNVIKIIHSAIRDHGADIILPFDPDEFLFHIDGKNPREELEKIPDDRQLFLPWVSYLYEGEPNDNSRFLPDYFSKYRQDSFPTYKTAITKELFQKYKPLLTEGRHRFVDRSTRESLPAFTLEKLKLAHYPLRSVDQAIVKVATGKIYYISRQFSANMGFQWNDIYEEIKRYGSLSVEQVQNFSLYYGVPENHRSDIKLEEMPLPIGYYSKPRLLYTNYAHDLTPQFLIKSLLVRMEEIIRTMQERSKNYAYNTNLSFSGRIKKIFLKWKRSIKKRLAILFKPNSGNKCKTA